MWKLRYNNLPKIASNRKVIHVPILLFPSTKIAEETKRGKNTPLCMYVLGSIVYM